MLDQDQNPVLVPLRQKVAVPAFRFRFHNTASKHAILEIDLTVTEQVQELAYFKAITD